MGRKHKTALTVDVQDQFVEEVECAYTRARLVQGEEFKNLKRGHAKCVSGIFEDVFAKMVYKHILKEDNKFVVLVDWPITWGKSSGTKKKKGKKQRPAHYRIDFMLCRKLQDGKLEILYMAELKENVGFMREAVKTGSIFKDLKTRIDNLKNATALTSSQVWKRQDKKNQGLTISDSVKFDLVLYSSNNGWANKNTNVQNSVRAVAAANNSSLASNEVWMHVLCDYTAAHKSSVTHGQIPCSEDFENLEMRIQDQVNKTRKDRR